MPDLFYTDPTTLQSYSYNPITGQMVPLGGQSQQPPNYGTRGYAGVRGMAGSPSGPAVSPQSRSWISSQPVGARSGLFTPVSGSVGSTITAPSVPNVSFNGPATYTDPTTLQSYGYIPSTGAVVASGPGYGNSGTVIPQTSQSGTPGSMGPVDRRVAAQSSPAGPVDRHDAAAARLYRQQHGLATADDSAATDALNAESLAAAQAGRNYFNPQLAQQYAQPMAAGQYGPRTDVVNALQTPQTAQPIMLAQAQQQPIQLGAWGAPRYYNYPQPQQQQQYAGNNLLAQGIY